MSLVSKNIKKNGKDEKWGDIIFCKHKELEKKRNFLGTCKRQNNKIRKEKKRGEKFQTPHPLQTTSQGEGKQVPLWATQNKMKMEFGAHRLLQQLKVELQNLMIKKT